MVVKKVISSVMFVVFALFAIALQAQTVDQGVGPGKIVKDTTDRIMAIVAEANTYYEEDQERYFNAIAAELDQVVDFKGFARGVMGEYASSGRYKSLDEAGREQLKGQLERFTDVIRNNLVRTYGKGLLAFGGSDVEVSGVEFSPNSTRVASVTQTVQGEGDKVYVVSYQMGQYKDGSWRLRNMIVENINLGEIYRGQFEAAVEKNDGDIDQVIDQWNAVPVEETEGE